MSVCACASSARTSWRARGHLVDRYCSARNPEEQIGRGQLVDERPRPRPREMFIKAQIVAPALRRHLSRVGHVNVVAVLSYVRVPDNVGPATDVTTGSLLRERPNLVLTLPIRKNNIIGEPESVGCARAYARKGHGSRAMLRILLGACPAKLALKEVGQR